MRVGYIFGMVALAGLFAEQVQVLLAVGAVLFWRFRLLSG